MGAVGGGWQRSVYLTPVPRLPQQPVPSVHGPRPAAPALPPVPPGLEKAPLPLLLASVTSQPPPPDPSPPCVSASELRLLLTPLPCRPLTFLSLPVSSPASANRASNSCLTPTSISSSSTMSRGSRSPYPHEALLGFLHLLHLCLHPLLCQSCLARLLLQLLSTVCLHHTPNHPMLLRRPSDNQEWAKGEDGSTLRLLHSLLGFPQLQVFGPGCRFEGL